MTDFISTKDLHFNYPNYVVALRGITLNIDLGDFVAIMGENGAGKTTLVKHFNGLLKPSKGSVVVDGVNTQDVTVAELSRKVGYVFQNPLYQLFCETVEKEIALGLRYLPFSREEKDQRITNVLKELGLERYRMRHPLMLSEGERKSVALASVLVMDPKALILDEPTLGQDALEKKRLEAILKRLNREGRTIILVSHDVEFVFDTVDRIITMAKGEILADGSRREVIKDKDLFREAGLVEPQILTFTSAMSKYGLQKDLISVEEVHHRLMPILRVKNR